MFSKSHSVEEKNINRVVGTDDYFLLLNLHGSFECSEKVAGLGVFVVRVFMKLLHGLGAVNTE